MSVRFICDGCGKSVAIVGHTRAPHGWVDVIAPDRMIGNACSDDCRKRIEEQGIRPPATITALKPVEGNEPWRKDVAEAFGGSAFLGALAGSVLGHALRTAPSGWARPMRGERCHYFVNQDSLCGEWKGFRGAVQLKPTVSHICETCKERHK